jgi:hypothetical protein
MEHSRSNVKALFVRDFDAVSIISNPPEEEVSKK